MTGRIVLVGGGVRSGKSAFALRRARELGERRAFVATATAFDEEMRERIRRHRDERGADFRTLEESLDLPGALEAIRDADVVVVDCLTIWLSNLLLEGEREERIFERVDRLLQVLAARRHHAVLVTNEVGMGVVPESRLGRAFRDLAGTTHQRLARAADEIHVAVLGCVLRLSPGPVAISTEGEQRVDPR